MVVATKGFVRSATVVMALLASTASSSGAWAQGIFGDLAGTDLPYSPSRGRNISVPDRPRPEYEAKGIQTGSFTLFPRVEVGVGYVSNVYSSSINPKGDGYVFIAPSATLRSDWSRHGLRISAGAEHQRYFSEGAENHTDWWVEGEGRYDIAGDSNIAILPRIAKTTEPRYSEGFPDDAAEPVSIRTTGVTGRATYVGPRVRLIGAASFYKLNYKDVDSLSGGIVDQDYRDREIKRFSGRGEYAFTPDAAAFVQISHAKIDYDHFTLPIDDRSADENMVLGGVSLDISGVIRGTAGVGYVERDFDLAAYGKSNGIVADVKIEWFVTEITTITATAHRFLRDSAVRGSPGYFDNQVGLRVDHELLRNLLLFAQAEYRRDNYQRIDRRDNISFVGGGARYFVSPQWELGGRVEYTDRSSSGLDQGRDINELRALVSVTWKR
jgi:hypothetical protein